MRHLRILVDGQHLGRRAAGDETYVRGLLSGLAELDVPHAITVACPRPDTAGPMLPCHPGIRMQAVGPRLTAMRNSVTLPRLAHGRADVLHAMLFSPLLTTTPIVLYLPDASYLTHRQFYPTFTRLKLTSTISVGVRVAKQIVTVSETARQTLLQLYRLPAERVRVTQLGVDIRRYHPRDEAELTTFRRRLDLPDSYFLYVGNLHPRKNLVALIEDYAEICKQQPAPPPLVVAGIPWWQATPIYRRVEALGLTRRVRFTGWVDDADLPLLIAGAQVFVYPSLVEGFGLPPLEAMASGVPVVALATSVFPEVLGDAAILVPPGRGHLARGISMLLGNPNAQAHYRAAGLCRADRYRWITTARETVAAYEAAAA